ncbi:MAG: hypothetical protein M3155_00070 [Actinomycetota bacterium]|nr:hypothetical protein [Actinomycetota bacterium]
MELVTPLPPAGFPLVVNGGQALAQAPMHVLFGPRSLANMYSVRPLESVRILPPRGELVAVTSMPVAATAEGVDLAGMLLDGLLDPPPQPAATTPIPATATIDISARLIWTPFSLVKRPHPLGRLAGLRTSRHGESGCRLDLAVARMGTRDGAGLAPGAQYGT